MVMVKYLIGGSCYDQIICKGRVWKRDKIYVKLKYAYFNCILYTKELVFSANVKFQNVYQYAELRGATQVFLVKLFHQT